MNTLSYDQKISVMRILLDIVLDDGRIDERENAFFDRISNTLQLDDISKKDVDSRNSLIALTDIKYFTEEQKTQFSKLMGNMIIVDKDINYREVKIYDVVNEFCNLGSEFESDDYKEFTHS